VQQSKVVVVDGNQMFNRPGPRLVEALEWLVCVIFSSCICFRLQNVAQWQAHE
jgi:hypothetical protein